MDLGAEPPVQKFVVYPPGLIITPTLRMVVYHLHGQTGWFTVWVNGKKNSGLVNFTPESRFNLYKSVSFSEKRPLKPEPGVKDGFDRSKKCNTNFRWKIPLRKTSLPYQTVRCFRKCFPETTYIFCMLFIAGRGREDVNPR